MKIDYAALIEDVLPTIQMLAWQTYPKIKKPTCIDVEDLVQEGTIVCWEWVSRWYKPDKGASPKTFAVTGIKCHFKDIIKKSWKTVDIQSEASESSKDEGTETSLSEQLSQNNFGDASSLLMALSHFTSEEKVYISEILFPTKQITSHIIIKPRQFRMCVREKLDISIDEENRIRDNIEMKLTKLNNT